MYKSFGINKKKNVTQQYRVYHMKRISIYVDYIIILYDYTRLILEFHWGQKTNNAKTRLFARFLHSVATKKQILILYGNKMYKGECILEKQNLENL